MTTETEHHGLGEAVAARVERRWAILAIVIVAVLVGMATFIGIHQATMPQGRVETADPRTLHLSGEFIESNLGSAVEADGSVTVRAIGQQYSFTPQCVVVPANTPVTFRATSADVVHGLLIEGYEHQHHAGAGLYFRVASELSGNWRPRDALSGILRDGAPGDVGQGQGGRSGHVPQHDSQAAEANLC
jgi:heme/copper-type cytochrome/quinol oxidase subunit 2